MKSQMYVIGVLIKTQKKIEYLWCSMYILYFGKFSFVKKKSVLNFHLYLISSCMPVQKFI